MPGHTVHQISYMFIAMSMQENHESISHAASRKVLLPRRTSIQKISSLVFSESALYRAIAGTHFEQQTT